VGRDECGEFGDGVCGVGVDVVAVGGVHGEFVEGLEGRGWEGFV